MLAYTSTYRVTIHPHSPSLITFTEIDTISVIFLLFLVSTIILGGVNRGPVFFERFIICPVSVTFKYLFAWKGFS